MALEIATEVISTGTGPTGTVITVNPGFEAKAIFAFTSGRTELVDTVGRLTHRPGIGMGVSPSSRASVGAYMADAVGTMVAQRGMRNDALVVLAGASATEGLLDILSIGDNSFNLVVDEVFAVDLRVVLWILGGDDISTALQFDQISMGPVGTQDFTGFGVGTPDIYFNLTSGDSAALPHFRNGSAIAFGAATPTEQATFVGGSQNAGSTSQSEHYALDIEAFSAMANNTVLGNRSEHSAMLADGFQLNWLEKGVRAQIASLVINGGDWAIRELPTATGTATEIPVTGLASAPGGGLVFSCCEPESVQDSPLPPYRYSMGAWNSPTSRAAHSVFSQDAVGTSEVAAAVEYDGVYARITDAAGLGGVMDIKSREPDGATFIMDGADNAVNSSWGIFAGPFSGVLPRQNLRQLMGRGLLGKSPR